MRLDLFLVENNFFKTRNKAQSAIKRKKVLVNDKIITKTGYEVIELDKITILKDEYEFVSRGGFKLLKAIQIFDLDFNEKTVLDLGASTGGFTDCALKFNAKKVYAVDVGSNQLDESLLNDKRVISIENLNIKDINSDEFNDVDFIVMDVSFISIRKLIDKLNELLNLNNKLVVLIKPQFEVENKNINKNGLVKDKNIHIEVINKIISEFSERNIFINNLTYSPIKGEKSGNIEYLALFSKSNEKVIKINDVVNEAYNNLL